MIMKSSRMAAAPRAAARRLPICHFKVTLKTPSGEQTIECSPDTYILDGESRRRRIAVLVSPMLSSPSLLFAQSPPPLLFSNRPIINTAAEEAG